MSYRPVCGPPACQPGPMRSIASLRAENRSLWCTLTGNHTCCEKSRGVFCHATPATRRPLLAHAKKRWCFALQAVYEPGAHRNRHRAR